MKLKLKKQQVKNLSKDNKVLPMEQTANIAGGKKTADCPVPTTHQTLYCPSADFVC
ncbi:hypothetical protein SG34_023060 [Thalassomonas viridans]|uniref:Class I lanthipeptide n=1 Tax=Thalassomonas viridans TaxID=137584 RepID=A0AAE9Z198_9GAMM|nr:hypothetical protein [Thalassomonas viridans]WDE04194.1 hypothetical protein SG34_023060 [Thalassomonas viridans]